MTKYFGWYVVVVSEVSDGGYWATVTEDLTGQRVYDGPVYGGHWVDYKVDNLNEAADGIAKWLGLTG